MEDGDLSAGTVLGNPADSIMDFDFVDELLLEGCWLETYGSEFLNPSPSNSALFVDPTSAWFASDTTNVDSTSCQSQGGNQEDKQMSLLPKDLPLKEIQEGSLPKTRTFDQNVIGIDKLGNNPSEGCELSRRWWIGPGAHPGATTSVMERLIKAIWYIKDLAADEDVLIQIWVPVNRGGRRVLTTCDQPFALDPSCQKLASYRDISVKYQFSAEEDARDFAGLPGRVFLGKIPEWTPDVRYFRSDEYLRVDHAQQHNVCGSLALPIFEQGSRICLGVIEVVMTTQKVKYQPELESVCKALEAVDLRCSEILSTGNIKVCDVSHEVVLPEIQEVLKSSCEMHRLPLAQTWVPCIQQGKGGSRHSDKNYTHCVSTVDRACYVADPSVQGFQDACSEHHLLRGQGVVGQAFMTNQPCFSSDITLISKTEYPLSHHARMFGLRAAVAIHLRSICANATDFVLEFFLPVYCRNLEEQKKKMLTLMPTIIQQVCRTLRVITDRELGDEILVPASKVAFASNGRSSSEGMPTKNQSHSERQHQENYGQKGSAECGGDAILDDGSFASVSMQKKTDKKQTMAEKAITPQVLQQYFSGSLKDAAKSIGVCPTTLKRICRQNGITRWPSRKIKKVGHSLQKLQLVIDSVQGASGVFHINSFYANFPELGSPELSKSGPISASKSSDHLEASSIQPEVGITSFQATATKPPSSLCSQRSSSSHCLSTGIQQHCSTFSAPVSQDPIVGGESGNGVLKRVRSDEELHAPSAEEPEPFPRSQSHKSVLEKHYLGSHRPLSNCNGRSSQDLDGQRAKVTYGNEKIRIRIPNNWKLDDLQTEIARRFNIDDISGFNMKYLDDDAEWVLLSCDEDLVECIDVCRSSQSPTIKLLLQVSNVSGRSAVFPHEHNKMFCVNGTGPY